MRNGDVKKFRSQKVADDEKEDFQKALKMISRKLQNELKTWRQDAQIFHRGISTGGIIFVKPFTPVNFPKV